MEFGKFCHRNPRDLSTRRRTLQQKVCCYPFVEGREARNGGVMTDKLQGIIIDTEEPSPGVDSYDLNVPTWVEPDQSPPRVSFTPSPASPAHSFIGSLARSLSAGVRISNDLCETFRRPSAQIPPDAYKGRLRKSISSPSMTGSAIRELYAPVLFHLSNFACSPDLDAMGIQQLLRERLDIRAELVRESRRKQPSLGTLARLKTRLEAISLLLRR